MLNDISWQQYFTAVIILATAWYAYVGLRYYRAELYGILKIRRVAPGAVPPVANQLTVVMGQAKPDADTSLVSAEELRFGNNEPDNISDQTLPKGPADDLLAEGLVLIDAFGDNGDKSGFLSLFNLLLDKYEVFADEISLPAIIKELNSYAAGKLPFKIQAEEWPLTFAS